MKFEVCRVKCKDKSTKLEVEKLLETNGIVFAGERLDKCLTISIDGNYYTHSSYGSRNILSYSEFLEKYGNAMINKIHQAKKELGLNNTELSLRMGKSKPYIAKMLNQKQSEKVQNKVIKEIDELLSKKDIKINIGESEITKQNLSASFDSAGLLNELSVLRHQNGLKATELKETKQHLEQKTVLIGKLSDQLEAAEKLHNRDLKALKDKDDQLLAIVESKEQVERERDYFVNQYKQSESDVKSLKKKIIRERWIIMIVIAILTGLFFLKGAIGG